MNEAGPSRIHFAALVGVAVDSDMFPYWIPHYLALRLDTYTIFLHEGDDPLQNASARDLFIHAGFSVTMLPENVVRDNPICPGEVGLGVRGPIFDLYNATMPAQDFLITADGDEIQDWPQNPRSYLERGVQMVIGRHVDCFDDTLHAPDLGKTLDQNYPIREYNLPARWRTARGEIPFNTKKICMSPARYPVEFSGSHEVKRYHDKVAPRVVASGILDVLHYRWRHTAFLRVKDRPNWPPEDLQAIRQFFGAGEV